MKKLLFVAFAMACLSFASCGNQTTSNTGADTTDTAAVDTVDSVAADSVQK